MARLIALLAASIAASTALGGTALAQNSVAPPSLSDRENHANMVSDKVAITRIDWEPRANEVAAAQTALKAYVDMDVVPSIWADKTPELPGEARLRHGLASKIGDYWVRATGIAGRQDELAAKIDGRPIIRLDGFCKVSGDTWKDAHFTIDDGGGDCYVHAEYDLAAKTIVYFEVNR